MTDILQYIKNRKSVDLITLVKKYSLSLVASTETSNLIVSDADQKYSLTQEGEFQVMIRKYILRGDVSFEKHWMRVYIDIVNEKELEIELNLNQDVNHIEMKIGNETYDTTPDQLQKIIDLATWYLEHVVPEIAVDSKG